MISGPFQRLMLLGQKAETGLLFYFFFGFTVYYTNV